MGFLTPKVPKVPTPPPAPNTPVAADAGTVEDKNLMQAYSSLISTGGGLRRKASTVRTSLIGGA